MEDFLREEISRRISLRAIRETSSFRTDATFDIKLGWYLEGQHLRTTPAGRGFRLSDYPWSSVKALPAPLRPDDHYSTTSSSSNSIPFGMAEGSAATYLR